MPQNPISTLGASPNGPLTHNDVREKINEVTTETNSQNDTLDHFVYNPISDKLEADKTIQAGLNSIAWGEAWTQSSGGIDLSFREEFRGIDHMPVTVSFKDQSLLANQDASGIFQPTKRIYTDLTVSETAGAIISTDAFDPSNPVTMINYEGLTTLSSDLSTYGIRFRLGEALTQGQILYYNLYFDDNGTRSKIFSQEYTASTAMPIGDYVDDFWWSQPASALAGQTVFAEIRKENGKTGPILQVYPNITETRHWNEIRARNFTSSELTSQAEINSELSNYDLYVKSGFTGDSDGSALKPYADVQSAVDNANDGDHIFIDGVFEITQQITIPDDKSLSFYGVKDRTHIKYASYSDTNGHIFNQPNSGCVKSYRFENLELSNAGGYGVYIKSALKVVRINLDTHNCGWNGARLSTTAAQTGDWASGGILGYDSTQADLQAFYASSSASDGGACRIESTNILISIDNDAYNNLRGERFQDCGIGGYGFVSRNNSYNNIDSGIYLASSSYNATNGCQNFTVYNNAAKNNANNGFLCVGGINNVIALNQTEGNWNAGVMPWHVSNTVVRDNYLLNNNRSAFNGIGNTGDALGSLYIAGDTINTGAEFIVHAINNQIVATGLGASTAKNGIFLHETLNDINDRQKSIILLDNNTMQGQDYALVEDCDLDEIRLIKGDNTYIDTEIKDVLKSGEGYYYELPFSNQHTNIKTADFSLDASQTQLIVKETATDNVINIYPFNGLKALGFGSDIRIILRGSNKIQFDDLPVSGCTIAGVAVNATLATAVNELNAFFTGTGNAQVAPVITSSNTIALTEGDTLNHELTATNGLAYEWDNLPSGVTIVGGTNDRKLIGGSGLSAGTYTFTAKSFNYKGFDEQSITLTVSAPPFATTKSVQFDSGDYAGANAALLDGVMGRSTNGDGKAWTLAMWVKPVSGASGRILFYYGSHDLANAGYIEARLTNTNKIRLRYGSNNNYIQLQTTASLTAGVWQQIIVTFDGGTTGASSNDLNDYYSRFNIIVDDTVQATTKTHNNNGFTGSISGVNLRIAKLVSGNTMAGDRVAQVAIWDTDETTNKSDIYNSGSAFDYMTLTNKPEHRWRMGDGDTFPNLLDTGDTGGITFVLYNSTVANIVTDSP